MDYFENEIFNGNTELDILWELERAVNVLSFNSKERYDRLSAFEQLGMFAFAAYVVNYIGINWENCSTDPRNEYSYKVVSEVQGLPEFQKVYVRWEMLVELINNQRDDHKGCQDLEKLAEEFTYKLHRTNQQTALGYMLYVLGEQVPELKQKMQELYGENGYYRFALI